METPQLGPLETGRISAGPFQLPYRVEGHGHPAIVVGTHLYYPRAFSQNLRDHLEFVFMDHRGFAPSPGPVDRSEFELEKVIDDIEALRRHLDLGRVAVIGHSGHGFMALEYAKKYPQNTSHVVMIGIAPDFSEASTARAGEAFEELADSDRREAERENRERGTDDDIAALPPDEAFVQDYIRNAARVWYDPRFDCSPLWEGITINMDMIGYVWGEIFTEIDVTKGLKDLKCPVFLALGRYDFIVAPPSSWDPVIPEFNDITVRVFERSGHTPQLEEPDLFDRELLTWMKRQAG
jgi:proline iminopeptidase